MRLLKYLNIIRYNDWWLYKTPPLLGIFYATLFISGKCIADCWYEILALLFYISSAAVYVCVINDITDRKIDLKVGKSNLFLQLNKLQVNILLFSTIALQVIVVFLLKKHGYSALWYSASIVSYSLYSIPPIRLKEKTYFGVFADAFGAHCFASIFIVIYAYSIINIKPNLLWEISIFIWSLTYGLRGIIWHQYMDREADTIVGLKTIVHSVSVSNLKLSAFIIFIVEAIGFAGMIYCISSIVLPITLLIYIIIALIRQRIYTTKIILAIVDNTFYQIFLAEFYELFMPLSILILGFSLCKSVEFVFIFQIILFPKRIKVLYKEFKDYYYRLLNCIKINSLFK